MPNSRPCRLGAAVVTIAMAAAAPLHAQDAYRQPPAPIAQVLDAEPLPLVSIGPERDRMVLLHRSALPPIDEVAAPFLGLGGARVNPHTFGPWQEASYTALTLKRVDGAGTERRISAPANATITWVSWAPDGAHLAFTARRDSMITLWVASTATGTARQLSTRRLNASAGAPCAWADRASLVCRTVPAGRGAPPRADQTPTGPVIQEASGAASAQATYQDLLQNAHDERLFDYYYTSQLVHVPLAGAARTVGTPGIYTTVSPSPDGRWLLVQALHRPYSYQVPRFRFPTRTELWTIEGRAARTLADLPLNERVGRSFDAVPTGLRSIGWRADAPATVVWAEAMDEGDPARAAAKRDRVLMLAAPFTGDPRTLAELEHRYAGVTWARDDLAMVDEYWWRTRKTRTTAVNPSNPGAQGRVIWDRSSEDTYGDPGNFVMTAGRFGRPVMLTTADGRSAYLTGTGASAEGDRPFLDRFDLASGATQRLFRSEAPYYEYPSVVLNQEGTRIITRRESLTDVPNYFLRDLSRGTTTALTNLTDPAPQFAGVTKQLITYQRADGVQLSATMYLPAGYDRSKGPLPFLFWAYPEEFKSAAAASQVSGSPYRFTRPAGSSHLFLLTQGYGVLDGPSMPIVGEGDAEPNDSYVQQLVSSAQAAVDKVVELGVADRDRIAVGGHSYGAFMTANLLSHSNIFRAGIARSGAYNRTLTPFGFQAEERSFWKAQDTYMRMSPFTYAHQVSAPILLIHGAADNNQGTFPVQSERYYAALKGNGKAARLVMLPAEPHGYRSRESAGHVIWEMVSWLDRYLKPAPRVRTE